MFDDPVIVVTDPGVEPFMQRMLHTYGANVEIVAKPHEEPRPCRGGRYRYAAEPGEVQGGPRRSLARVPVFVSVTMGS